MKHAKKPSRSTGRQPSRNHTGRAGRGREPSIGRGGRSADAEAVFAALEKRQAPTSAGELGSDLKVAGAEQQRDIGRFLRQLKEEGRVYEPRPGRYAISGSTGEYPVTVEEEDGDLVARFPDGKSAAIHPRHRLGAKPGDRAQAMVDDDGQVLLTRLVARSGRELTGSVILKDDRPTFIPDNRREGEFPVLNSRQELKRLVTAGERMIGVLEADGPDLGVRVLRALDESSPEVADFTQVCLSHDLPGPFAEEVEREARSADPVCRPGPDRRDLRQEFIITIDPATAKDFDDAIQVERRGRGWRVGVHIADVTAFVRPGTALDAEAARRGTSVYLANRVIPMIPEALSNGLCSLKPNEDRYCLSMIIDLDDRLKITSAEPVQTLIHSRHRLTYEQALEIIEKRHAPEAWPQDLCTLIHDAHRLAQSLRTAREKSGALNLFSVEHDFQLDAEGNPMEVLESSGDVSHQLIEELMLLANRAVARWLFDRHQDCVYRIHGEPDPERLEFLAAALAAYGMGEQPVQDRMALQRVLRRLEHEPPAARLVLNFLMLRCFQKAVYSVDNIGHYALAFTHYAHFTSPIRRYPDLLVHRLVKRTLALKDYQDVDYRRDHLDALARSSSNLEQRAEAAERDLTRIKAARYLARRVGETFAAVVTGAAHHGLYVQLLETGLDGLVSVRELKDDFYAFDADRFALVGTSTGRVYGLGMECTVEVVNVDVARGEVTLALADQPEPARKKLPRP